MRIYSLPERLRLLRRQNGHYANFVAGQLSVSTVTYSRWEHGTRRPSLDNLVQLADFYKMTLSELLADTDVGEQKWNDIQAEAIERVWQDYLKKLGHPGYPERREP